MQYTLHTATAPDLAAIERSLGAVDPAALIDLDSAGSTVRISTLATEHELLDCLREAGLPDAVQHLERVPSECCGGCGG